jgi:hypothetical protein
MATESGWFALLSVAEAGGQGDSNGGNRSEKSDGLHGDGNESERKPIERPKD